MQNKYLCSNYKMYPLTLIEGNGCFLKDVDGNYYLDMTSGIGVNCLGYHHEGLCMQQYEQIQKMTHLSNVYYNPTKCTCAQKLCEVTGCANVFFSNSGAEANEAAIKAIKLYHARKKQVNKTHIVSLWNSFHGRTQATLTLTGQGIYQKFMEPLPFGYHHCKVNDIKDFLACMKDNVGAIFLELIQGEGGVIQLDLDYVKAIERYCKTHDVLLVIDEVQTGIGRCGSLFLYEQYQIQPDIVTCAKGLGGGLPIGATLFFHKTADCFQIKDHGSTFGGNLVACASANYVLEQMHSNFLSTIQCKGLYLKKQLEALPFVEKVCGLGFMIGIYLKVGYDIDEICNRLIKKQVLVVGSKNCIRLLPPLLLSLSEIHYFMKIMYALSIELTKR